MRPSFSCVTSPSYRMRLCFKRVYKLGTSAFSSTTICHPVLPCDSQNTSEAAHVTHIQLFLLVCRHCPSLTSIKQSADYSGFIYIDFGMIRKLVVRPYSFCQPGECHGSLSNSLIEFTVDGQVVCDGRPQVHKHMNDHLVCSCE